MRKFLLPFLLTGWLTAACCTLPFHSTKPSTLMSLVVVTTTIEDHPSLCTGFVVSVVDVLTARHCVAEDTDVLIDGQIAHVFKVSPMLALLRSVKPIGRPILSIRATALNANDGYLTFGFGMGKLTIMQRNLLLQDEGGNIYLDGPLIPGMSGGPVVDAAGDVVGINQMTNGVLGLASGPEEIRAFLAR